MPGVRRHAPGLCLRLRIAHPVGRVGEGVPLSGGVQAQDPLQILAPV